MPGPELLAAFALAVAALMVIPGPNVALIVSTSLSHGVRWGLATVVATAVSSMVQLALVVLGLSSIVSQLGGWFGWLRWLGVAYLIFLGIQQWRIRPASLDGAGPAPPSFGRMLTRAAMVSVTNPKTLLFYAAFFPQFMRPEQPALPQIVVLAGLYLLIALAIDSLWALTASRARTLLRGRERVFNRAAGTVLIGAGVGLALQRAD